MKIKDTNFIDILKNGGVNFIFYALNLLIVYILAILISKNYGSAVYGRFSILKSLVIILTIFATLGMNTLATKMASDKDHYDRNLFKSNFLEKSYSILIISSLIICSCFYFFKNQIALSYFKDSILIEYFSIFPIILLLLFFLNYNSNLFKGQGKILLFSTLSSFLGNFILLIYILTSFYFFSKNEIQIVYGFLIGTLISLVISLCNIFPLKSSSIINKVSSKKIIFESFPMMLSASMVFIIFSLDTLMLGYFVDSKLVGIYRVIVQISSLNTIFLIVLGSVVAPKVAKLFSQKKTTAIKKIIISSSKLVFIITLPILLIIIIFGKEILLFFGEEYVIGFKALLIISFCQFFYSISGFVDVILNMTGNQRVFGKITMFSAFLNFILNIYLIPKFGIIGAAIATGITILLTNIIGVFVIKKRFNFIACYIPFLPKFIKN